MRQITIVRGVKVCCLSAGCRPSLWRTAFSPPTLMCGKQAHTKHIHKLDLCFSWMGCPERWHRSCLPSWFSAGHLELFCGKLPLWQSSLTKVCPMNKFYALSWRGGCWRNRRAAQTCCKTPEHTQHPAAGGRFHSHLPVHVAFILPVNYKWQPITHTAQL